MSDNLPIVAELTKLAQTSAIVELFELDLSPLSVNGETEPSIFFHAGTNELSQPIVFLGRIYNPLPVRVKGFEFNSQGRPPRPSLAISNVGGWMSALLGTTEDLVGARVIRRRTYAKYLDGMPDAADIQFPIDTYVVNQKVSEDRRMVELELVSSLDLDGVYLPRRQVTAGYCSWRYRGQGCLFSGTYHVSDRLGTRTAGADFFRGPWSAETTYTKVGADADSVQLSVDGYLGLYVCQVASVTGADHSPALDSVSWSLAQRFRGQYKSTITDYATNDVVWVEVTPPHGEPYKVFSIALGNGTIPSGANPLSSAFWEPDVCTKQLVNGCRPRFDPTQAGKALPFGGFPGTSKLPEVA